MKKALVASAAIVCAAIISVAAARWVLPVTGVVGFNYTDDSFITVHFDINNSEDEYSQLAPESIEISCELAQSYIPDAQGCSVYDGDARRGYVFDGWYTSPEGGERVGEDITLQDAADGAEEVTLYAHWKDKCAVQIMIIDNNFASVDGQFSFCWTDGGTEQSEFCASASTGTFTFTYYVAEGQIWRIDVFMPTGEKSVEGVPAEQGHFYSYTITVYSYGGVTAPSTVTDNII